MELDVSYKKKELILSVAYGKTKNIIQTIIEKNSIGMIVSSSSYVRYFREILDYFGTHLDIPVVLIDDASLIPPWIASDHVEYGAYTLRKKYWNTATMLSPEKSIQPVTATCLQTHEDLPKILHSSWYKEYLSQLKEMNQGHENKFVGGESHAQKLWHDFKKTKLHQYDTARNNPNKDNTSLLSPFLHF